MRKILDPLIEHWRDNFSILRLMVICAVGAALAAMALYPVAAVVSVAWTHGGFAGFLLLLALAGLLGIGLGLAWKRIRRGKHHA